MKFSSRSWSHESSKTSNSNSRNSSNSSNSRTTRKVGFGFTATTLSQQLLLLLLWLVKLQLVVVVTTTTTTICCCCCFYCCSAFRLTPSTPPGDIVERQLTALRNGDMASVYECASPGNKKQTGDLARFSTMVRSGPYRHLVGHSRSDILIESKMGASRQFLVRVVYPAASSSSSSSSSSLDTEDGNDDDYDDDNDDDDDDDDESYPREDATTSKGSSNSNSNSNKVIEYWWSLSRCKTGEFPGSYMVDAVIPNQI